MEPIEKEKRFCLNDGKEIIGREGKMFCSDKCRNTYNNLQNKDATNLVRNINNRLRKNHRILSELNVGENPKVELKVLKKKGFDFEFFTSVLDAKTGNKYYFVYDQGFCEINEDVFLLVKSNF
jgi:hypothetical protein